MRNALVCIIAALQIKAKWIMSRPAYVVRPEKSLTDIMENMFRFGVFRKMAFIF